MALLQVHAGQGSISLVEEVAHHSSFESKVASSPLSVSVDSICTEMLAVRRSVQVRMPGVMPGFALLHVSYRQDADLARVYSHIPPITPELMLSINLFLLVLSTRFSLAWSHSMVSLTRTCQRSVAIAYLCLCLGFFEQMM